MEEILIHIPNRMELIWNGCVLYDTGKGKVIEPVKKKKKKAVLQGSGEGGAQSRHRILRARNDIWQDFEGYYMTYDTIITNSFYIIHISKNITHRTCCAPLTVNAEVTCGCGWYWHVSVCSLTLTRGRLWDRMLTGCACRGHRLVNIQHTRLNFTISLKQFF